ncbi:hypothetical protein SBV1_810011 [Verrucomicrobia bacterium]|nr:hypothetical protein SBV1_810011 [Verrucomicrobiota bacterium]
MRRRATGESFTLTLGPGSSGVTGYQWVDWKGNSLGTASFADSSLSFVVNSPAGSTLGPWASPAARRNRSWRGRQRNSPGAWLRAAAAFCGRRPALPGL